MTHKPSNMTDNSFENKAREAKARDEAWAKLTLKQQLESLDSGRTPSGGVRNEGNSARQRARLMRLIEKQQSEKIEPNIIVEQSSEKDRGHVKAKDRRAAEQSKRSSR